MRRVVLMVLMAVGLAAGRAEAVSVRDLVELSKAGLSDQVLIALVEVDRTIFTLDAATLKQLKEGGVSDAVILAVIKSGREKTPPVQPVAAPAPEPPAEPREPQVIVVDHHDAQPQAPAPVPVAYPVAVPVYVPVAAPVVGYGRAYGDRRGTTLPVGSNGLGGQTVTTIVPTDQGLVKARVPVPANCIKAEPVYWGFGGKLRPDSWQPAPTVVCR